MLGILLLVSSLLFFSLHSRILKQKHKKSELASSATLDRYRVLDVILKLCVVPGSNLDFGHGKIGRIGMERKSVGAINQAPAADNRDSDLMSLRICIFSLDMRAKGKKMVMKFKKQNSTCH